MTASHPTRDAGAEQAPSAGHAPVSHGARALDVDECRELLERIGWGVLATTADGGPYGVPVAFGLGSDCLYLATGGGEKRRNLERDGRVCLTVCDVAAPDTWRSVVVRGNATPVRGLRAHMTAVRALVATRRARGAARADDARRLLGAAIFRLSLHGMTGRSRGA